MAAGASTIHSPSFSHSDTLQCNPSGRSIAPGQTLRTGQGREAQSNSELCSLIRVRQPTQAHASAGRGRLREPPQRHRIVGLRPAQNVGSLADRGAICGVCWSACQVSVSGAVWPMAVARFETMRREPGSRCNSLRDCSEHDRGAAAAVMGRTAEGALQALTECA